MHQKSPLTVGQFHRAQHLNYRDHLQDVKPTLLSVQKLYFISYNVFQIYTRKFLGGLWSSRVRTAGWWGEGEKVLSTRKQRACSP
jgi:hypothetical protein